MLANVAKSFAGEVRLQVGDRSANARSVTSLMALEVTGGDKVVLVAKGPDAKLAIEKLSDLIAKGLGDEGCPPAHAPATMTTAKIDEPAPRPRSDDPNLLLGVAASPGLAVGNVFQVRREEIIVEEEGRGLDYERHQLEHALDKARVQLEALRAQLHGTADPGKAAIFAAHAELLDDPDFLEIANSAMAKGQKRSLCVEERGDACTPSGSHRCAMSCSRNALMTCAMSVCACSRFSPASRGWRRAIRKARS